MEWEPFEWELPEEALARAAGAARLDVPVLVIGETGTGHEWIARYIHAHSRRATGPFVSVNCPAVPDSILEGEFAGAAGGTLFAYPVHPISPRADRVLCRLLEDGAYQPIGAAQALKADVRIVVGADEDLQAAYSRGEMSKALCGALSGYGIFLPPLRERRSEIIGLAEKQVAFWCDAIRAPSKSLTPSARDALRAHSWPGNLRELFNVLGRAVLTSGDGEKISAANLPKWAAISS